MTNLQDYDSFEDAAECILGAAEELAAAQAVDDEIPVDAEEVDNDASLYSTETEASANPTMEKMANIADSLYNDIDPLDGIGLLREKCCGTFVKFTISAYDNEGNIGCYDNRFVQTELCCMANSQGNQHQLAGM